MLRLVLDDVRPFLRRPLTTTEEAFSGSLLDAMSVLLDSRYGGRITQDNSAFALFNIGQALTRVLSNQNPNVIKEGVEGTYAEYASHTTKGDLFLPAELTAMDAVYGGKSSLRSIPVRWGW